MRVTRVDPPARLVEVCWILFCFAAAFCLPLLGARVCRATSPSSDLSKWAFEPVPRILHQTYYSKSKIPPKVAANMAAFAPRVDRRVYDDDDAQVFLESHFPPAVLDSFRRLKVGAHKADLLRYALLFVYGEIYMDIKTQLVEPLNWTLFPAGTITSVLPRRGGIYQGILASPPRHPLFLELIDHVLVTTSAGQSGPSVYLNFTMDFYDRISSDLAANNAGKPREGLLRGKRYSYHLLTEVIRNTAELCEDGLDRYNGCSNIYTEGRRVFKSRYADFPWKRT